MLYGVQETNIKTKTWVYHVKRLLYVNRFGYVWMYGEVGDERRFLHVFKEHLKYCFYQRWWTHNLIVNASIFIIVLRALFSVKDI